MSKLMEFHELMVAGTGAATAVSDKTGSPLRRVCRLSTCCLFCVCVSVLSSYPKETGRFTRELQAKVGRGVPTAIFL